MDRNWLEFHGTEIVAQGKYEVDWPTVRKERDNLLKQTDWRAGKDVVLSTAWRDYRQALRDLPQEHATANDAVDNWPVMPDE